MAIRATRCVAYDNEPAFQQTVTDDAGLTITLSRIFDLKRDPGKNQRGICEIQSAFVQRSVSFCWIKRDSHRLLYIQ